MFLSLVWDGMNLVPLSVCALTAALSHVDHRCGAPIGRGVYVCVVRASSPAVRVCVLVRHPARSVPGSQ